MIKSLFNIRPAEKHPVFLLFSMFFFIVFASITGSSMRDAIFLIHYDKTYLPIMYLFVAITMILIINLYNRSSEGKNQLLLLIITGIIFSITLLAFQFFLSGIAIPLFYVWIEIITIFSVMQFWLVTGEIFNSRQAKRIFPLIIAGGSLAAILSGYSIKPFVTYFSSQNLIYLTIGSLLVNVIIANFLSPFISIQKETQKEPHFELNAKNIKNDSYIVSIGLMIAFSAIISRIIDYQFKIIAVSAFPDQDSLVNFFGTYYGLTGFATLLMQLSITGFILKRFGILSGLLILPISLAIGSLGFLLSGTLLTVFIAKFSDQVFKFSINNSIKEILWLPISAKKKLQTKPIIDGIVRSGVEGISGLVIFLLVAFNLLPENQVHFLSAVVLLGISAWVWSCFKLTNGYISSIVNSIENRQLNLDEIEFSIDDTNTVKTLDSALLEKNELKQLFAIDLLWNLPLNPWKDSLEFLFTKGSPPIQRAILELTWNKPDIISDQLIIYKIKKEDDISPHALMCANDRGLKNDITKLDNYLNHDNNSLRIAYAVTLLSNDKESKISEELINRIHKSNIVENQIELIGFLKRHPHLLSSIYITNYLQNGNIEIKNEMLRFLINNPNISYFNHIFNLMEKPATEILATKSLLALNKKETYSKLSDIFSASGTKIKSKKLIIKLLHHFIHEEVLTLIFTAMDSSHLSLIDEASNALIKVSKNQNLRDNHLNKVEELVLQLAQRAFQLHLFKSTIINDQHSRLIKDHVEYDLSVLVPVLLKLGTLKEPEIPIEKYIHYVKSNDKELLPLVLELVESTFTSNTKKFILPLIDPDIKPSKVAIGLFDTKFLPKDDFLLLWMESNHIWKKNISLDYCLKNEKINLLKKINWKSINNINTNYNFLNKTEKLYLNRNFIDNKISIKEENNMYSILEKTILLKSVNLFQNIPGNILSKIAQIALEIHLEEKDVIFKEGDSGSSLFVIISGKVDIIKNNQIIANLEQGNCIGEMSLLDQEPRSADAVSNGESILLKIDQDGFFELMASNSEIIKQIMKMLTKRLRQTNKKLTDSLK